MRGLKWEGKCSERKSVMIRDKEGGEKIGQVAIVMQSCTVLVCMQNAIGDREDPQKYYK